VKLTLSDFRADALKERRIISAVGDLHAVNRSKHWLIETASTFAPSQFWYIMPPKLRLAATGAEWPKWAGAIEVTHDEHSGRLHFRECIKAPRIHSRKIEPKTVEHANGVCYYRMHDLLLRIEQMKRDKKAVDKLGEAN